MNLNNTKWMDGFGMLGVLVCVVWPAMALAGVTVNLDRPVHFLTPGGDNVVIEPGVYDVEQAETWLRLVPDERQEAVLIQAEATTHDEVLPSPMALSVAGDEADGHHVLLLLPDGKGLEAIGSYSGVRSRGALQTLLSKMQRKKAVQQASQPTSRLRVVKPPAPITINPLSTAKQPVIGKPSPAPAGGRLTTPTTLSNVVAELLTPIPKGTPMPPSLKNPQKGFAFSMPPTNTSGPGPKIEFEWDPGAVNVDHPAPERYTLCVQPVEVAWGSFNAGCHYVPTTLSRGGFPAPVKFSPPDGVLPVYMEGKKLKWGVAACRQQRDLRGVPINNTWLCSSFHQANRDMQWPLFPPVLVSPNGRITEDPDRYLRPTFRWQYSGAALVTSFKFCLYREFFIQDCENGTAERVVSLPGGNHRSYQLAAPTTWKEKGFRWTVAACFEAQGCNWSEQVQWVSFSPQYVDRNACVLDVPQAFTQIGETSAKLRAWTNNLIPSTQYNWADQTACGLSLGGDLVACGYSHFQGIGRLNGGPYLAISGASLDSLETIKQVLNELFTPQQQEGMGLYLMVSGITTLNMNFIRSKLAGIYPQLVNIFNARLRELYNQRGIAAHLFIVHFGTRAPRGIWGTNMAGASDDGQTPIEDRVVARVDLDFDNLHPGGIQTIGDYVVIGLGEKRKMVNILFYDLSNPVHPRLLTNTLVPNEVRAKGYGRAVAITRRPDGHYLLALMNDEEDHIKFLRSTDPRLENTKFEVTGVWRYPTVLLYPSQNAGALYKYRLGYPKGDGTAWAVDRFRYWPDVQSWSFVRQCDGQLFAIAPWRKSPSIPFSDEYNKREGSDYIELFKVHNPDSAIPRFQPIGEPRYVTCGTQNNHCNFYAAGAAFVTPDNQLLIYGVDHWPETGKTKERIRMGEFAPR